MVQINVEEKEIDEIPNLSQIKKWPHWIEIPSKDPGYRNAGNEDYLSISPQAEVEIKVNGKTQILRFYLGRLIIISPKPFANDKWILSFNEKDVRNSEGTEPDELESLK